MKTILTIAVSILLSCFAISVFAGTVSVPNTFVAGQTAIAADVNANFTALETGVNGNAADIIALETGVNNNAADITANSSAINFNTELINNISSPRPVLKDGNNQIIGFPLYTPTANWSTGSWSIEAISLKGYYFVVIGNDGSFADQTGLIWYQSADCSGTKYIEWYGPQTVISVENSSYYIPVGATAVNIPNDSTISRIDSEGECISSNNPRPSFYLFPVQPNDPAISGVPATPFTTPLRIDVN